MAALDIEALRVSVKASGLKQKYIAEQVGVAEKTLSYMLKGRTRFPIEVYAGVCSILGMPLDAFIRSDQKKMVSMR